MRNKVIAVIDDDLEFTEMLGDALLSEGFDVVTSMSGLELISLLSIDRPAAVLISTILTWIDSIKLLRAIKTNPALKDIKIFFVCPDEWLINNRIERTDSDLISGIFCKPIKISTLIKRLKEEIINGSP